MLSGRRALPAHGAVAAAWLHRLAPAPPAGVESLMHRHVVRALVGVTHVPDAAAADDDDDEDDDDDDDDDDAGGAAREITDALVAQRHLDGAPPPRRERGGDASRD